MTNKNSHASYRLQNYFRFFIMLAVLLTTSSVMAQDKLELQWELVNPFRFIHDQGSIDELRKIYAELKLDDKGRKTAYNFERELQRLSEADVERIREEAKGVDCDNLKSDKEKKICLKRRVEPFLGWFAKLAEGHHAKTCWDSDKRRFRNKDKEVCSDYINPKKHKVRVWISNSQPLVGSERQWFVDNQPLTKFDKCADKHQKGVCIEFDIEDDVKTPKLRNISVKFSDSSFTIQSIPVLVEDKLIVGLGDSYAAGEGNPDIPAQFTEGKSEKDILFKVKDVPAKDDKTEAGWLEQRCHRSMYSYQFKTALHFALANPQKAVTFVTYSCSGATTSDIIDTEGRPKEGIGRVKEQLKELRKVLVNGGNDPREIDYLLLSTGGNEVGFGKFGAYILVKGEFLRSLASRGVTEEAVKNSKQDSTEKLLTGKDGKEGNYLRLHKALLHATKGIRIKGCRPYNPEAGDSKADPCTRILLTPYPNIVQDEEGEKDEKTGEKRKPCKADRGEFDVSFGEDPGRAKRIEDVKQFVFEPLQEIQKSAFITDKLGWKVITEQLDEYLTHGFCARNKESKSLTGEKLVVPTKIKESNQWKEFDPRDYRAYEKRQRWARIPVDAKLTTDQENWLLKKLRPILKLLHLENLRPDLLLEDDRSNILHPTAEGLAETADANFREIERQEAAKLSKTLQ